ncbi:MAG TPA: ATP synthase F1 subunit delta [Flavobacteriaceae bacterium]|nr:ATP synthase F1 subunit delta [Flavobacteriaceae bacterium]
MSTRAALRYAKAILSYATEQNQEAQVNADMALIENTIKDSEDLQLLLNNPILKSKIKKATLKGVFGENISALTFKAIDLLIDNQRLPILQEVAKKYTLLFDQNRGKEEALVTTAFPITEDLSVQVLQKVKEITGKDATLKNIVNPDIIGGFILRIGDIQYNASVANKLNTIKRQFDKESYISKL